MEKSNPLTKLTLGGLADPMLAYSRRTQSVVVYGIFYTSIGLIISLFVPLLSNLLGITPLVLILTVIFFISALVYIILMALQIITQISLAMFLWQKPQGAGLRRIKRAGAFFFAEIIVRIIFPIAFILINLGALGTIFPADSAALENVLVGPQLPGIKEQIQQIYVSGAILIGIRFFGMAWCYLGISKAFEGWVGESLSASPQSAADVKLIQSIHKVQSISSWLLIPFLRKIVAVVICRRLFEYWGMIAAGPLVSFIENASIKGSEFAQVPEKGLTKVSGQKNAAQHGRGLNDSHEAHQKPPSQGKDAKKGGADTANPDEPEWRCPLCGAALPSENAKFCGFCGNQIA